MSLLTTAARRLCPSRDEVVATYRQLRYARTAYRPIFVTGTMGSGTTLLAFSLGSRFDVAGVVEESGLEVSTRSFLHMALVDRHRTVADYERAIQPRADWSVDEGRRWLRRLYRTNTARSAADIVDKGPNVNLVRAGFLNECFPAARFVLVVRDPVANIEGFRRKWPTFGRAPLSESIGFYRRCHEHFLELAEERALDVVIASYEDLVASYEGMLAEVGRRLDLSPRSVTGPIEASADPTGKGIRNVTGSHIGVLPGTNAAAYDRLADDDVALIRSELGDLHQRLLAGRVVGRNM